MRTVEFSPGSEISRCAAALVKVAPARGDFNGITLRARYATTNPRDLVSMYHRILEERSLTWRHSPAGKKSAAEQADTTSRLQAVADALTAGIGSLDFTSSAAVLGWVEAMADPADRVGVSYDHKRTLSAFGAAGWLPGVNCEVDFNGEDPRNFAGWIVGQWLASRYPGVTMFAEQWREKFAN